MGIVSRSQGGGGSGTVATARVSRAVAIGGNITLLNSTVTLLEVAAQTGGPGTGGLDLTVAAAAGDVLSLAWVANFNNATASGVILDAATWVSGAAVNWLGQTGGSGNFGLGTQLSGVGGTLSVGTQYVVQAGDVTGGNVVLRPHYRTTAATNRILGRSAADGPLYISVANFKQ